MPIIIVITRLVNSILYMWIKPLLNLEGSLKTGLMILYTTFIGAMVITTIIAESTLANSVVYRIFLIFFVIVHTSASNFIEFKLVQLVYILPEKFRRVLVAAEAWAGVYAALYITFTSLLL